MIPKVGSEFLPRKVEVNAMMTMMKMMFLVGASEAVDEGKKTCKYLLHRVYPSFCWFYSLTHQHLIGFCCASASYDVKPEPLLDDSGT